MMITLSAFRKANSGFNLIEAAIVLAVVGAIIGAIWVAAATLQSTRKINEVKAGITLALDNAKNLLPPYSYPSTFGTGVYATPVLVAAGALPKNWTTYGNHIISSSGIRLEIIQSCWGDCPILGIRFFGPNNTTYSSNITAQECTALARQIISVANSRPDFIYVQTFNPTNSIYYKPVNASSFLCSSNTIDVVFWFMP